VIKAKPRKKMIEMTTGFQLPGAEIVSLSKNTEPGNRRRRTKTDDMGQK
jgi:hypothetical protein